MGSFDCTIASLIDRHAAARGDKIFAVFDTDEVWTYNELRRRVRRTARALETLGVKPGDRVAVWLPNGAKSLLLWMAICYRGAIHVGLHTALRGNLLTHVLANAQPRLLIAHGALLERLPQTFPIEPDGLIAVDGTEDQRWPVQAQDEECLWRADAEFDAGEGLVHPWDVQSIIYTSGTTGPSKGALSTYLHLHAGSEGYSFLTENDRGLVTLPLSHIGGQGAVYRMLARGASIAMIESFRTQTFWQQIDRYQVSFTALLGAMIPFLLAEPPSDADRKHALRTVLMVPLTDTARSFGERFNVDVFTNYNMTETSSPIFSQRNPTTRNSCGVARPGFALRIVDENDIALPAGEVGELIIRSDSPWTISHGYYRDPETSAKTWRNGWFHTGDRFRVDHQGNYYFVDRLKDAIRRRGENISAFEVENELLALPGIREAAAVGVKSELGEEEVLAVIAPKPGAAIDFPEVIRALAERLPHFMVPRYLRLMDELPKNTSHKVVKHELRQEGVTAETWDREKAGIVIKAAKLGSRA